MIHIHLTIPCSSRNAPLLRRLIMHQYIYSLGNKMDKYFLYQSSRTVSSCLASKTCSDPTRPRLSGSDPAVYWSLRSPQGSLLAYEWLFERNRESCGFWSTTSKQRSLDVLVPIRRKRTAVSANEFSPTLLVLPLMGFFNNTEKLKLLFRAPTSESCDPKNPTFPFMGGSKRLYFVRLTADGQPEWQFNYHKPAVELWTHLVGVYCSIIRCLAPLAGYFGVGWTSWCSVWGRTRGGSSGIRGRCADVAWECREWSDCSDRREGSERHALQAGVVAFYSSSSIVRSR